MDHFEVAARCHAERPLPGDELAEAVRRWRDARRGDPDADKVCRAEVVAQLQAAGYTELAAIVRDTPDVAIEVTRTTVRVISS